MTNLRIAILSEGSAPFSLIHSVCAQAGHTPLVYVCTRSNKPSSNPTLTSALPVIETMSGVPRDVDIILPASGSKISAALVGYELDLLVCCYFRWKLPLGAINSASMGAINIHASILPKYRGPLPVHWAIRSGDRSTGVTVHRMDEEFDTGPILSQVGGVDIDEDPFAERIFAEISRRVPSALTVALDKICADDPGDAQPPWDRYYGWMEPEFQVIDWSQEPFDVHNQVRTFRFATSGNRGPVGIVDNVPREILRTSLSPTEGVQVPCGSSSLWIVESASVDVRLVRDSFPWISANRS